MHPETIFITRYVASHEASLPWYEKFFGRSPDAEPVPGFREWRLGQGVLFQVIEDAGREGEQSVAFGVADLTATASRLPSQDSRWPSHPPSTVSPRCATPKFATPKVCRSVCSTASRAR